MVKTLILLVDSTTFEKAERLKEQVQTATGMRVLIIAGGRSATVIETPDPE